LNPGAGLGFESDTRNLPKESGHEIAMAQIRNMTRWLSFFRFCGILSGCCAAAAAGEPGMNLAARTVILVNSREPESVELGKFYATRREIPADNLVALPMPEEESITRQQFVDEIWQPLQDELVRRGWLTGVVESSRDAAGRKRARFSSQRIAYLVTCRGTPLKIQQDATLAVEEAAKKVPEQFRTNQSAVDSELSLLAAGNYDLAAFIPNPLFGHERPADPRAGLVIKVARLDGPTFEDARRLVTSALTAEERGLIGRTYVDLHGPHPDGDRWLEETRRELDQLGFDGAVEDTGETFDVAVRFDAPVLYFGWYASDINGPFARPGFVFPPGAIALHIHSYSAETLRSATKEWCGPLVARGVTATFGNVFEPYLQLSEHPELLVQALARGATLGDAAYYALPALSWQAVVIGDPLYRPFKVSLEEQQKNLAALPADAAPYVVIRAAKLLERQGRMTDARGAVLVGLQHHPSLALLLFQAQLAVRAHDTAEAKQSLEFLAQLSAYRPEEWAMVREAAQLLAKNDARETALKIYSSLAQTPAPGRAAERAMVLEAWETAKAAGDAPRAAGFEEMLRELDAPRTER
jgi:uncharacterized protein (TIGR03790 family)